MKSRILLFALLILAGCQQNAGSVRAIAPFDAIQSAAAAAPQGVPGVFELRVRATGRQDGNIYLNSEADYRDQRSLTVAVQPSAFAVLEKQFGAAPDVSLNGKTIRVRGVARRVRIDFVDNGQPSGKYYFQTHVAVARGDQIEIVG
jgi:hypothetical protein